MQLQSQQEVAQDLVFAFAVLAVIGLAEKRT